MMNLFRFREFLQALADTGVVRVCGSYAAGTENTQGHLSDLDLYVLRDDVGMKKVIAVFAAFDVPWESVVIGHIASPRDAVTLPMPVECSYHFNTPRRKTFRLIVLGVEFIAYEQGKV